MPAPPTTRTLLHLSDLHFGPIKSRGHYWNSDSPELSLPNHDQRGLLGSLCDDLRREHLRPDAVLVTGDLLDRGSRWGVRPVLDFLRRLAAELHLPVGRVVLIPGNHDVLRVPETAKRYALFDKIRNEFYGSTRAPFAPDTLPHHRVERFDFADELGIEIIAFNSCERLEPPKNEHGSIGQAQRRTAELLLEASQKGLFRIALMHHHLTRPTGVVRQDISEMDDAGVTVEWLARQRFRLALHGHQHVDWEQIQEINGWFLSISAAGSAGVGQYGRKNWDLRLGYQVIVIDSPESGHRIRREYNPQSRLWHAAGNAPAVTPLRFGCAETASPERPHPTKASVRALMDKVLILDEHLDMFCGDHFPEVAREFTTGMLRSAKINVLLKLRTAAEIIATLQNNFGTKVQEYE